VVIRRSDGSMEYIAMEEGQSYKKEESSSSRDGGDEENGIEKTGDNKYTVEQEVIDQIMENPEKLYSQIRVVPHKDKNGDIDGYRVSGVRRKSFFYKLGVKNGDIVHSVNSKPLTSMSSAMDAYNSLAESKSFTFDITRRNQQQTFNYEIR
jgi:type II secretion system protein C